jgi:hypothetical protein
MLHLTFGRQMREYPGFLFGRAWSAPVFERGAIDWTTQEN